ncbi:DotU family type IV/VI secretion system protein [Citrobacter portucalensis]|uniref:DotU family type IV/VI secretion system protein n=1 Tax=Citrobacter portucalensis TaxID=1639133 RepID=UPI00226B845C|nr:DotU family type IV/VI secretion system protein [Citrobacter portucalensis]MCX9039109.1 DotU family type IV/VI secretion system protein [Citrobacter portucalensis]
MSLLDSYLPVFKIVLQMISEPTLFIEYDDCRQECIVRLDQAIYNAKIQDASEAEKEAARTAVIAWLDETILLSTLPWRQRWQSESFQRKYLNTTVAGEFFFTLLEQLEPAHEQARAVFLFCLQLGFLGQYSTQEDKTTLMNIIVEQRRLCLPEEWLEWPNHAAITPISALIPATQSLYSLPLLSIVATTMLIYGILYIYLHHYVF